MAESRTQPHVAGFARRLPVLGIGALLVAVPTATAAVGLVANHRAAAAPSVTLKVNDAGRPLFNLPRMRAGEVDTACELVTSRGPAASNVGMFGQTSGNGLQRYLTLSVTRGSLPVTTPAASCAKFVPDAKNYRGTGPGVLFNGPLAAFPTSAATPLVDPVAKWPAGRSAAYRMTVSLANDNAAQGLSAVQRFTYGATAIPATPVKPTKPTKPVKPIKPIVSPTVTSLSAVAAKRTGRLTISFRVHGPGSVRAVATLQTRKKSNPSGKAKVTTLGKASVSTLKAAHFRLTIKPTKKAMKLLRKRPKS